VPELLIGDDGWLVDARRCPSPNCNPRPDSDISLVVIHGISLPPGEFGGPYIEQLFTNTLRPEGHPYFATIYELQVSAHLLIRRDGALVQFVPFGMRAWHAGRSTFAGRVNCNDYSIGIELEGTDEIPYTDEQYVMLCAILDALKRQFPAIGNRIAGHDQIAPGRKTDPGPAFDWGRLAVVLSE
jgi:AmpD protein